VLSSSSSLLFFVAAKQQLEILAELSFRLAAESLSLRAAKEKDHTTTTTSS